MGGGPRHLAVRNTNPLEEDIVNAVPRDMSQKTIKGTSQSKKHRRKEVMEVCGKRLKQKHQTPKDEEC